MGDINRYIKPAIMQAQLSAIDSIDGLVVSDISDDLIEKIYKADVLVIDANCYEPDGLYQFSHYLYYYIAIGHSRGNMTILVTNNRTHLPPRLVTNHTLIYSSEEIWEFIEQFKLAVAQILQSQEKEKPDNPIQAYRSR